MTKGSNNTAYALVLVMLLIFMGGVCLMSPQDGGGGGGPNGNSTTTTQAPQVNECESHTSVSIGDADSCLNYECLDSGECCVWHYSVTGVGYCECVPEETTTTTTFMCVETDGGPNPMVWGQCNDGVIVNDVCLNPETVYEATCAPNCQYQAVGCPEPFMCVSGNCVPMP